MTDVVAESAILVLDSNFLPKHERVTRKRCMQTKHFLLLLLHNNSPQLAKHRVAFIVC